MRISPSGASSIAWTSQGRLGTGRFLAKVAAPVGRATPAEGSTTRQAYRARVSASQMPLPIMKPPDIRDISRVRCLEKNFRARPASSA
jgi:hypothetical protein